MLRRRVGRRGVVRSNFQPARGPLIVSRDLPRLAIWFTGLNLAWEIAQLPLYTIWWTDPPGRIAFAVLHCTSGDLIIGTFALATAVLVLGRGWPDDLAARRRVVALVTVLGVSYTAFSEWLNVVVRESWAYTDWMPVVPLLGTGLAPMLQWFLVPGLALCLAYKGPPTALPLGH
jgi:hypothetical protein